MLPSACPPWKCRGILQLIAASSVALLLVLPGTPAKAVDDFGNVGKRFAIDLVLSRGHGELRGLLLGESKTETVLAVRRDWLERKHPDWLRELDASGDTENEAAQRLREERIDAWVKRLEARPDPNRQLIATISLARDELKKAPPKDGASPWVVLRLPAADVRRTIAQPPERRQLALVAWDQKLPRVEETPATALEKTVAKAVPNWKTASVGADSPFPATEDSDEQWEIRTGIWEFQFGEQASFQGTGDSVFRADRADQRPPLAEMLPAILQGGVGKELQGLLSGQLDAPAAKATGEPRWLASAKKQADSAGLTAFRVTMVDIAPEQNQVAVDSALAVKTPEGEWRAVWVDRQVGRGDQARAEDIQRIRNDPQLTEVLKVAESLGVAGEIDRALRMGAGTMAAQQEIDRRFQQWVQSMTRRLDGPPIAMPRPR